MAIYFLMTVSYYHRFFVKNPQIQDIGFCDPYIKISPTNK
jgi:hypothetical protein